MNLRVWDSSLLFLYLIGGREEGKEWGDWPRNLEGCFWNESSKELPAACINRPQLAQRGNSICRELCCILFIEELLVIRPYTTSCPKHQATQQEVQTFFFYKIVTQKWSPSHHPIQKKKKKKKKNSLNKSPVSSCVWRWRPVCSAKLGIYVNPSTTKSA